METLAIPLLTTAPVCLPGFITVAASILAEQHAAPDTTRQAGVGVAS